MSYTCANCGQNGLGMYGHMTATGFSCQKKDNQMTIPNNPTRYRPIITETITMAQAPKRDAIMISSDQGEFVEYSDYETLAKQMEEVTRQRDALRSDIGIILPGDHPDEAKPRGVGTWLSERGCWQAQINDLTESLKTTIAERDAALAQVPKLEWDFGRLKGIMIGEYKHYVEDGMDADGNELGHEEIIEWTTIKGILGDGLAAMMKLPKGPTT
jgi:hypothetical protein